MKKIISLVLALTLLVGMLGVSAVALAEETTPTVTANQDKIDAFIAADNGTVDKRGLSVLSKALLELGKITVSENLDKTEADNLFTGMTRTFGTDGKLESSADKIQARQVSRRFRKCKPRRSRQGSRRQQRGRVGFPSGCRSSYQD